MKICELAKYAAEIKFVSEQNKYSGCCLMESWVMLSVG